MVESIAKLFEFLSDCWEDILPYFVVPQTQRAVVLRNGIFLKEAGPGPHWKMPKIFSIGDEVNYVDVITETTDTDPQSLTTSDGYEIVVSTIIKHRVSDPKTYLLDVFDVKSAIVDITMSRVKKNVMARTWEECKDDSLDNEITKQTRVEAKKWGVYVEYVTVINLAKMRSLRLISNNPFQ
jgi:regulator of protease activity HflC (stomatin/prohibitin superfamily)